jgi:hypothetical protein
MNPEYRGRRVLREDKGDTAEAGVSQVWCAGTGGASVGQKGKVQGKNVWNKENHTPG